MEYISKTTDETAERSESKLIRRIHKKIRQIRKSEKAGVKYMLRWEEEMEVIVPICDMLEEFAPEYDSDKVYEKLSADWEQKY